MNGVENTIENICPSIRTECEAFFSKQQIALDNFKEKIFTKVDFADENYVHIRQQLKAIETENARLRATISDLKHRKCSKCYKSQDYVMSLKKDIKSRDDTIAILTKLLSNARQVSYDMASQMVVDEMNTAKTPPKKTETKPENVSPVVLKPARRSKRKLSVTKNNDDDIFSITPLKTPEKGDSLLNCIVPLDPSPEILRDEKTIKIGKHDVDNTETNKNPKISPTFDFELRNKSISTTEKPKISPTFALDVKFNGSALEKSKMSLKAEPKGMTAAKVNPVDGTGNKEPEKSRTKWHLKKSRVLSSNDKLKQTVLSTAVFEKKVDISTLEEYNGGYAPKKLDVIMKTVPNKENSNETFFEPLVTSTVNEPDSAANIDKSPKKSPLEESTNKIQSVKTPIKTVLQTPTKEDSFDCIPSTSPRYKYKRDAVRKKSDRLKLPGQGCEQCINFYEAKKDEMSGTQIQKLLNKCSRHRDKFPVIISTPPGLWNPLFDDTDEENEAK